MSTTPDDGWKRSAAAWLAQQGETGDFGRVAVLDPVMVELAQDAGRRFVDIGCGEGRFVRRLAQHGIAGVGIDPTEALVATARARDPGGDYRVGQAEALPCNDAEFDFAVFYLSLCDIAGIVEAVGEAVRVVRPGGRLLIANLSSVNTAGAWVKDADGRALHYAIDDYARERPVRQRWAGIDVLNWHRPFSAYFEVLLGHGLTLRRFLEPLTHSTAPPKPKFDRVPNFVVMDWQTPG